MPSIEEVRDRDVYAAGNESDYETDSTPGSDADGDAESVLSISLSETDDFDPSSESIQDRLLALKDIVPPSTRLSLVKQFERTSDWVMTGGSWVGNAIWVVTTSALLVGLPLALAIEDEARIVQQEKEFQMQQSGQQSLLGAPSGETGVRPPGF